MKTIELRRRELVWEERRCTYTEKDFNEWKEGYKKYLMSFNPVPQNVIDKLDELTFDIVYDYIDDRDNEEKIALFNSFTIGVLGHNFDLLRAAKQDIREMNFECDICSSDYLDDYDEDWSCEEDEEDEEDF